MQKTFFFIRHGQSLANAGGKPMPDAEIPLTDTGKKQAKDLCMRWQKNTDLPIPQHIFSSEFLRAEQTANTFCNAYHISLQQTSLLNEFSYLSFNTIQDLTVKERSKIAHQYWQTASLTYRDGSDSESFGDFLNRIIKFKQSIDEYPHQSLFFGHGMWIALLTWDLLGHSIHHTADIQSFRLFQQSLPMHNTIVYQLIISDGLTQLKKIHI